MTPTISLFRVLSGNVAGIGVHHYTLAFLLLGGSVCSIEYKPETETLMPVLRLSHVFFFWSQSTLDISISVPQWKTASIISIRLLNI